MNGRHIRFSRMHAQLDNSLKFFPFLQSKKTMWCIVAFTNEEDDLAVVPTCWVKVLSGSKYCYWPDAFSNKARFKAVHDELPPQANWEMHPCRTVLDNIDNYDSANRKAKEAEYTSDLVLTADEDAETMKKRRRVVNRRPIGESEPDSPLPKRTKQPPPQKKSLPPAPKAPAMPFRSSPRSPSPPPDTVATSHAVRRSLPLNGIQTPASERLPGSRPMFTPQPGPSADSGQPRELSAYQKKVICLLEKISKRTEDNSRMILAFMRNGNQAGNDNAQPPALPEGLHLPVNTMEEFDDVEERLLDEGFKKDLIAFLSVVGGRDGEDCTRRVLEAFMTNRLATLFNFKGRGDKRGIYRLRVWPVICTAVRNNPRMATVTNAVIDATGKNWLKYANDRADGRENRRKKAAQRKANEGEDNGQEERGAKEARRKNLNGQEVPRETFRNANSESEDNN